MILETPVIILTHQEFKELLDRSAFEGYNILKVRSVEGNRVFFLDGTDALLATILYDLEETSERKIFLVQYEELGFVRDLVEIIQRACLAAGSIVGNIIVLL